MNVVANRQGRKFFHTASGILRELPLFSRSGPEAVSNKSRANVAKFGKTRQSAEANFRILVCCKSVVYIWFRQKTGSATEKLLRMV